MYIVPIKVFKPHVDILTTRVDVVDTARDLAVIIDSQLSLSAQVAALSRSGYFQLRQLRPIIRSLTMEAAKTIAQAFISCRLDYCNSLLYGISDSLLHRLQSVQNAAARLVTGTRRCDHITPVLRQWHWLPVRQRIHFKIAGRWIFQALTGQAPPYLADDCRLISDSGRRRLRSSDIRTCVTPRTSTRFGDRSFSAAGPQVWNGLPSALRAPDLTFDRFKLGLKTCLFTLV